MNGNEFLDKMSLADPAYVEEADRPVKKRTAWRKWGAMAACLAVLLGVGFLFFPTSTPNVPDPVPTELPTLPVSMGPSLGGYGYEGYYVRDISDLKNTSPSQIVSLPDTLPVFRNATGGYPLQVATEEYKAKMLTLCRSVAGRLGWDAENMTVVWDERSDGLAPHHGNGHGRGRRKDRGGSVHDRHHYLSGSRRAALRKSQPCPAHL